MADQRPKENQKTFRKECSMKELIERLKRRNDTSGPYHQNNFYHDSCVESSAKPKGQHNSLSQSRFPHIQRAEEEALADRPRRRISLNSVAVSPERVILPRIAPQGHQPVNLVSVVPSSHQEPLYRKAGSSVGTQPRFIFALNNEKKKSCVESDAVASCEVVKKKAPRRETPAELRAYLEANTSEEDIILESALPTRQPPASAKSRDKESQAKKYLNVPKDASKSAMETASVSVVQTGQIEKQVRMWTNPDETVAQAFKLLSSETWEKKVDGLNSLRALLQNHGEALKPDLHGTCLAIVKEVKNLRSSVSLLAIETLGDMYVHLNRAMDKEVEWTAHVLLLKAAEVNNFIRQAANQALGKMVQHCSPARVMKALLLTGLSHRSVAVRSSMAQHLEVLSDILGPKQLLKGKKELTGCFLISVNKMVQDSGLEVRSHARNILQKIVDDNRFPKMWEKFVPLKEHESLKMVISKLKSWTYL